MYIANQENLEAFCARATSSSVLAIDTEFLREKTYWANLCLLQLATDEELVIIDPFAVRDLSVLAPLLRAENIVKLFHAGRQDIEILRREVGEVPHPIFDTQLAAALLGHSHQIGYGALVHAECGVSLRKVDSFTDWSSRPLSASQLDYAADDVFYLPKLYEKMKAELAHLGRLEWLDEDFAHLCDPKLYDVCERERFRHLKHVTQLEPRQLSAAREFASWRELEAQKRNIPRKWLVGDEQIVEACKREASTISELFMVRGMRERLNTRDARVVAACMKRGLDADSETWPDLGHAKSEPNVDVQLDLMTSLVRLRAKENGVAFQTLANHSDLVRLARGYTEDVDMLRGWRRELVGNELLELLEGKISLSLAGDELVVKHI